MKLNSAWYIWTYHAPQQFSIPIYHGSRRHRAGDRHTNLLHRSAMLRLEATTITTTVASVSPIHLKSHLPKAATE
jgi:hypothetical protein